MNFYNIFQVIFSQVGCVEYEKVSIKPGCLCQGEIKNPPSNVEKVLGYLMKGSFNEAWDLDRCQELSTITQKDGIVSYNYIICDYMRLWWFEKFDELTFYNVFEFVKDGVKTRMPGIFFEEDQRTKKASSGLYEMKIGEISSCLRAIIHSFIKNRTKDSEKQDDYYRSLVSVDDEGSSLEKGKFSAKKFILDQIDYFKGLDNVKDEREDTLSTFYKYCSKENIKTLIGDTKSSSESYSEEEIRLYIQRCLDILNEFITFFKAKSYIKTILPEKETTFKLLENKKVLVFEFNFQSILNKYEDVSSEKEEINPEDFLFYDESGFVVKVDLKDIMVFNEPNSIYSYVIVDFEVLKGLSVKKVTNLKLFSDTIIVPDHFYLRKLAN